MESIPLPQLKTIKSDNTQSVFEISPLYPGYGSTVANALRRVLLSSMPGAAVDSFQIENVNHEFSSIEGVKEDVIEITINIKSLRVKLLGECETATLRLEKNKAGEITAADFEPNSDVEILNPEHKIATLDKNGKINLTVNIKLGRGYQVSEDKEGSSEIGLIIVDSFFSPIKHVSYEVEDTRVGRATNFDKVLLTVETDGSIDPRVAVIESSKILTDHYALIANIDSAESLARVKDELNQQIEEAKETQIRSSHTNPMIEETLPPVDPKMKIEDTDLSGRTKNALIAGGFKTLSGLARLSEIKLAGIKGLGAKGLEEVQATLKRVEE